MADSWEEIATDPFSGPYKEGQQSGRISGREAGYKEGYGIGRTTALNYGLELGYIQGLIDNCDLASDSVESEPSKILARQGRIKKSIQNLRSSLQDFPSASDTISMRSNQIITPSDGTTDAESPIDGVDVEAKMQRIRARFKLLCVQLDPHKKLQLASIMEEVTPQSDGSNVGAPTVESMTGSRSW